MVEKHRYLICHLDDINSSGSVGFSVEHEGSFLEGFVVRAKNEVMAYQNHCPHTGASLNWAPDQFLTTDADFIQCGIHGALFRLNDGFCVRGPCIGKKLKNIDVSIESGQVFVDLRSK